MTMKIVHKDSSPAHPPHLRQHTYAVIVREVMKEKRCHDDVKRRIAKRQFQSIPGYGHGALCQLQTSRVQIERDNAVRVSLEQRFADIASTRCDIQHE